MLDNFNVDLEINKNSSDAISVNGFYKFDLISYKQAGLEYFETACGKREIKDEDAVKISSEKIAKCIKEIFRCSICLEVFKDPVNIKSCLHKFCKKCIEEYNRRIKKECAICRQSVENRRLTKEDGFIRKIINSFIPNIDEFNEKEEDMNVSLLKMFVEKKPVQAQPKPRKDSPPRSDEKENTQTFLKNKTHRNNNSSNVSTSSQPVTPNKTYHNQYTKAKLIAREKETVNKSNVIPTKQVRNDNAVNKPPNEINTNTQSDKLGVILLYDDEGNEGELDIPKKYRFHTQPNIPVYSFKKYISVKNELKEDKEKMLDKMRFYTFDRLQKLVNIEKDIKLIEIREKYFSANEECIKVYFKLK